MSRRAVSVMLLISLVVLLCSCGGGFGQYRGEGLLTVHFLDVGQSDCTFIEVGGEYTVMIDTADAAHADKVARYVRSLGYEEIDALVLTHPHSDHIGGAEKVIESFYVRSVYMTDEAGDEPYYSALLGAVEKYSPETVTAESGVSLSLGELNGTFLTPGDEEYENENDMSAVLSICYGNVKFLFMGDAGTDVEQDLLEAGADLSADVVKAGHHGSNGSSCSEFIEATGAAYAVFSCGIDNDYGHPSVYALDRWAAAGAVCCRTDIDSTVVIVTDGERVAAGRADDRKYWQNALSCSVPSPLTSADGSADKDTPYKEYVLDTASHTVHVRGCGRAMRLSDRDREYTNADIERLIAEGYKKCRCFD